jgi:2-phospho-L-lactate guanylyltransferase
MGEEARRALALAMTHDVLEAVVGTTSVTEVVLVSDDPALGHLAGAIGALVVPDPGLGLNEAFLRGMAGRSGEIWTAMLMADLPCLTSDALKRVLEAAAEHRAAVVADHAGAGSTLLATAPGFQARPRFGAGSFHRHVAGGAVPVASAERRARCDVDTEADLGVAIGIGLGRHTARAVADLGLDRVSLNTQL